ncbi:MAG: CHAT domain-containing protein [Candidatus Helarchaeota archaeon]
MDIVINRYEVGFDDNNLINKVQTTWMETDFTPPIELQENFEIYVDGEKAEINLLEDFEEFSLLIINKNCEFKRYVREHQVFPSPEIILKVENKDQIEHSIKLIWKIKSKNNYSLIHEEVSDEFTYYKQNYLFFLKIPEFYKNEKLNEINFVIETDLKPGKDDELHITMFFSRNFLDSLGFSGVGFFIEENDIESAIAAISTNIFGSLKTNNFSFPIRSIYSPIFWMNKGEIPNFEGVLEIIKKSPIKRIIHSSDIKEKFKKQFEDIGITFTRLENKFDNKNLDYQNAIDTLFDRTPNFNTILIVPENYMLNMNLASYIGRLGLNFIIYDKNTLNLLKKIDPSSEIILIGTENEISPKFKNKLQNIFKNTIITWIDIPFNERYFTYQIYFLSNYVINKLILRELIDPDDSEWELFLSKLGMNADEVIQKYIRNKDVLDYEQLVLSEVQVNGPQNLILSTFNENDPKGWQNSAIGANFAKSKNALCFIVQDYSKQDKRELAFLLKQIDENLDDYQKLTELSIRIGTILNKNIPLMATSITEFITLFPSDASIPFELIFKQGRFGIESIGTKYCIGRLIGDDIYDTSILTTSSLIFSLVPHSIKKNILLVGNPIGDLDFSQAETAFLKVLLKFYGIESRYYAGAPVSNNLRNEIINRSRHFGHELDIKNIAPIDKPTKDIFLKEIRNANIIHYSGHGGLDNGTPYLVLSDDIFSISDIPKNLTNNPFIFANACLAGLSVNYSKNISLASKFIESGAIGYIGALWRVSDESSLMLGTLFYDFLIFLPIGSVLRQLKLSLFNIIPDDYTPLSFILYGDPTIHWVDPFYKSIEAFFFFKNLTDAVNTNQEHKAKNYSERTIYAFNIFKKELETRIRKKPENERIYTMMLKNLESQLAFLNGQYETLKILVEYSQVFSTGDIEKFGILGEKNIKISDTYTMKASELAWNPDSKFQYSVIGLYQKTFGNLLIAISKYAKKEYDKTLEFLQIGFNLTQELEDQYNKKLHSKYMGFVPFLFIEKQLNVLKYLLTGWEAFVTGIKLFSENKDSQILQKHFNLAFSNFSNVISLGDLTMNDVADNFLKFLFYDYGTLYFDVDIDSAENLFNKLKLRCEQQLQLIASRLDEIQRELPEEFSKIELLQQYIITLQYISEGFLHWINYKKDSDNKDEKKYAIEMFTQAIDLTPNNRLKKQCNEFLKKLK